MQTRMETVHGAVTLHRVLGKDHTDLLSALARVSQSKDPRRFPGSNPCSLERADFPRLNQQPYFLAEKTNGIRFLMFSTTHNGKHVCAIVDRAMSVWLLPLQALPTALFQGSVVDCELAFNKVEKQWQLLAFDAYVVSGVPVFDLPFSHRMSALKRAMAVYVYTAGDPVPFKIKSFVPATMFAVYLEHEATARAHFDVDGLILTPELSHATIGRSPDLLKLKTHHTIDFQVGPDGVQLGVWDAMRKTHAVVERLRLPSDPGAIVECERGADSLWVVVCVRTDKTTANDLLTYERTKVNMREGITYEELQGAMHLNGRAGQGSHPCPA